jgi:hypothetical protein
MDLPEYGKSDSGRAAGCSPERMKDLFRRR